MLTCSICESSIHKTHYASQIIGKTTNQNHLIPNIEEWKCQRCRYLLEKKFQIEVKCQFCPSPRGIMKKVIFEPVLNFRKQIWVHPECTTWCHPLIYMKSKKRTHYFKQVPHGATAKFWFRVQDEPTRRCTFCNDNYGYKIKCSFYSCLKFYHITCAKRIGIVRDLQSMRFELTSDDFCPIYCQQHLQGYVLDFANRIKLYTQRKQLQKVAHFTKVHNCYKTQLKNLTNSAKRAKQQQQIRNQLGRQLMIQNFQEQSISLSVTEERLNQIMESNNNDSNSVTFLTFLGNTYQLKDLDSLLQAKGKATHGHKTKQIQRPQQHPEQIVLINAIEQSHHQSDSIQQQKPSNHQQSQIDQQNNIIQLKNNNERMINEQQQEMYNDNDVQIEAKSTTDREELKQS